MFAVAKKLNGMWRVRFNSSPLDQFVTASRMRALDWAESWNAATTPLPTPERLNATAGKAVWRARG